jgi:FlaA1/EpsC-like NDP-sugar epimerase
MSKKKFLVLDIISLFFAALLLTLGMMTKYSVIPSGLPFLLSFISVFLILSFLCPLILKKRVPKYFVLLLIVAIILSLMELSGIILSTVMATREPPEGYEWSRFMIEYAFFALFFPCPFAFGFTVFDFVMECREAKKSSKPAD